MLALPPLTVVTRVREGDPQDTGPPFAQENPAYLCRGVSGRLVQRPTEQEQIRELLPQSHQVGEDQRFARREGNRQEDQRLIVERRTRKLEEASYGE